MRTFSLLTFTLVFLYLGCNKASEPTESVAGPFWRHVGIDSISVVVLASHPSDAVFAGCVNNSRKLIRTTDDGETWTTLPIPTWHGEFYVKTLMIDNTGMILASTFDGMTSQLIGSTDLGLTWKTFPVNGDIISGACDSHGGIYIGTAYSDESGGSIQVSTDKGDTWSRAKWPTTVGVWLMLATTTGTLIVPNNPFGIVRSTDFGQTWSTSDSGIQGAEIWTLAENSIGQIYASASFSNSEYSPTALFVSTDDGLTWTRRGSPQVPIEYLVISAKDELFAASGHYSPRGVFRSDDGGATWIPYNEGFNQTDVIGDFTITPSGFVYITTTHGLLRSENSVTAPPNKSLKLTE